MQNPRLFFHYPISLSSSTGQHVLRLSYLSPSLEFESCERTDLILFTAVFLEPQYSPWYMLGAH